MFCSNVYMYTEIYAQLPNKLMSNIPKIKLTKATVVLQRTVSQVAV